MNFIPCYNVSYTIGKRENTHWGFKPIFTLAVCCFYTSNSCRLMAVVGMKVKLKNQGMSV